MQKYMCTGRLVEDVTVRYSKGDNPVAVTSFRLAIDGSRYDKEKKERETFFTRATVFGKRAETAGKYLKKGTKIEAVGEFYNDDYTDRDGNKRSETRLRLDDWGFAESRKASENAQQSAPTAAADVPDDDSDIWGDGFVDDPGDTFD